MKIAVTGAFSYSGKYITSRLLARGEEVITLTNHPNRPDPFDGKVKAFPLDFDEAGIDPNPCAVWMCWSIRIGCGSTRAATPSQKQWKIQKFW
jgi:nucleoside-diphosphate-sugar epimerase